jgi:hypothetical protein
LLRAAHDALGVPELGDREQGERDGRGGEVEFDWQAGR